MATAQRTAPVKWAQRKDSLYVTIALPDVANENIHLDKDKLTFTGESEGKQYHVELEFFKEVQPEGSVWKVLPRSIQMNIKKANTDDEFWPRLLKDKQLEKTNVKVDWDRWADEDEGDDLGFDMSALDGGMNFGNFGDFGGFGGDEDDSDDEADLGDLDHNHSHDHGHGHSHDHDHAEHDEEEEVA